MLLNGMARFTLGPAILRSVVRIPGESASPCYSSAQVRVRPLLLLDNHKALGQTCREENLWLKQRLYPQNASDQFGAAWVSIEEWNR